MARFCASLSCRPPSAGGSMSNSVVMLQEG
jgi:hypothetical protein